MFVVYRHAEDKIVGNEGQITLLIFFWGGEGGGDIFMMLTPLLQSMEFVVAISNTDCMVHPNQERH